MKINLIRHNFHGRNGDIRNTGFKGKAVDYSFFSIGRDSPGGGEVRTRDPGAAWHESVTSALGDGASPNTNEKAQSGLCPQSSVQGHCDPLRTNNYLVMTAIHHHQQ